LTIANNIAGKKDLISVIVPLYNGSISICRCIDSILGQTYQPVEVIVINDGSTDNSLEMLERYKGKIHVLQQENKGPAAARNYGIAQSRGEFLTFLDGDDYWLDTFLEECIAVLKRLPEAVAVSCATKAVHWTGKEVTVPALVEKNDCSVFMGGGFIDNFFDFWAREDHIRTGSVVISTKHIPMPLYQLEELRISEDLEYWGLLATYGKWAFLPTVLFITDGTVNAAATGWLQKNKVRRQKCPTIETWQQRILGRVSVTDMPGFKVMRGKIAGNFAHAKVLAGDYQAAKEIVDNYGCDFKDSQISRLLQRGVQSGHLGWSLCCRLLCVREWIKALSIFFRHVVQKRIFKQ
jgi:glycosyltransferase involved in cell wall biosynthesis